MRKMSMVLNLNLKQKLNNVMFIDIFLISTLAMVLLLIHRKRF